MNFMIKIGLNELHLKTIKSVLMRIIQTYYNYLTVNCVSGLYRYKL